MLAGMPESIAYVTLNGKTGNPSVAKEWIRALNDPRILKEKAGFVFKASFAGDHLMLAAAPFLIDGQRSYHFNMHLQHEDAFTLIGDVSAAGVFNLLFKPESREFADQNAAACLATLRRFADFLLSAGYRGAGELDEVTQGVLERFGLSPAPRTLADL